ncbi:MAG: hypothetical protein GX434_16965 [Peptococcaceae bacterium]|nr:hypothetical protein [Peptococcaceae bacterium]
MVVGAIAPFSAGLIYDLTNSYFISFSIGLAVMIVGTLAVMFAIPPEYDRKEDSVQTIAT